MQNKSKQKGSMQFTQFSLIGIINGAIDLIVLNVLLMIWHTQNVFDLTLINSLAYALAVINSYYWNAKLTFRWHSLFSTREKMLFAAQATISLIISNVVFLLFIHWFGFFPIPLWVVQNASKGLSMATSSTCSFFFMKYFVFKQSPSKV
jgi:putative flippase GtrA